jgi:hypothetical protein
MQDSIVAKLTKELNNGIHTEAQTVYFLVQIRKLMEHNSDNSYDTLKMFCDWGLHIELSKNRQIIKMLEEFDEAMAREDKGYGPIRYDYLSLNKFKESLKDFLADFSLPQNILSREQWSIFIRLYAKVVSDCPVTKKDYPFKFIEQISMSDWQPDNAPTEYYKIREGFYLQWRVLKKDGTQINWEVLSELFSQ